MLIDNQKDKNKISIFLKELVENIKNGTANFDECLHVINHDKSTKEIKKRAFKLMKNKALTFSQWKTTYNKAIREIDKEECLLKMSESAQKPEEWDSVYFYSKNNKKINSLAERNLNDLSRTLSGWIELYNKSTPGGQLENIAIQNIEKICDGFIGWDIFNSKNEYCFYPLWKSFKMCCYAKNIELRRFAVEQFDENYKNFSQNYRRETFPPTFWDMIMLIDLAHNDEFLLRVLARKLFTMAETFDEWRKVYHLINDDEMKKFALIKMAETAKGMIEKKRTCHCTPEESSIRKEIGNIMRQHSEKN